MPIHSLSIRLLLMLSLHGDDAKHARSLRFKRSGLVLGSLRTQAFPILQDAAAAPVDSPQIQLASGLTREASGASSDLGSTADAEAEIRRLTQVPCKLPVSAMLCFFCMDVIHMEVRIMARAQCERTLRSKNSSLLGFIDQCGLCRRTHS